MIELLLHGQMRVTVLASGSRGNATLVESGREALLIDAGISGRRLRAVLTELWGDPAKLTACFLTHEHMDHSKGLKTLFKAGQRPRLLVNGQTRDYLQARGMETGGWDEFETGSEVAAGAFRVSSFPVPHDAYDPCGFSITAAGRTAVICTDLGYATAEVKEKARAADILVLEANYDEAMLAADPKRPWSTKQRIMARHGHLSNVQAAELLADLKGSPLKHVLLAHLSEDCNRPDLAVEAAEEGLLRAGLQNVCVQATSQNQTSSPVVV